MDANNIWFDDQVLDAQMWIHRGVDGNFLETDPAFSFSDFPNFTPNHQWAEQLSATSSISPDTALFNPLLFNPGDNGLSIPSNTAFSEQLPIHDGFYLDVDADATKVTDADDWEKFCHSMTSINDGSQWGSPAGSSPIPTSSASCSTSFSLSSAFSASEISGSSSSAMGSSPGAAYRRFSDDSENCEPAVDQRMYELSEGEVATALGWEWTKSDTVWLEDDVSSEITHFPAGFRVSSRTKIFHLERVTGLPSQIPITVEATAFLIDLTNIPNFGDETVDAILKDQDPHSWGGSTGSRSSVDAQISAILFGCDKQKSIDCRRCRPKCGGCYACESLAPEFLNIQRRGLDPHSRESLVQAQLRTRETQDNTRVGQALAWLSSIRDWKCPAIDESTDPKTTCKGGHAVLKKVEQRVRNKNFILLCSNRDMFNSTPGHRNLLIPDHIDQDLIVRAMTGEKIVEDEDQEDQCCRISSARQGKKGKMECPFNHVKEGRPFAAKVIHLTCEANLTIFIPHEDKYPELARMCIVVPDHKKPHRHPVPPPTKVTRAVAEKYRECVRKYGVGATVGKIEKALSTKEILGTSPSLFHPALLNRDTKQKLINQVKDEGGSEALQEAQTVATYVAKQQARLPDERYIQSIYQRDGKTMIFGLRKGIVKHIHSIRSLDCDTTFKPVKGKTNMYEINGWLMSVNESVTLGRVWMDTHDRPAFKFVWEELQRLVKRLTNKSFGFVALHQRGTILGANGDMEAAAVLGLADAMLPTIDIADVAAKVQSAADLLKFILRICFSHLKRGLPELPHLSHEDHQRICNFMYLESPAAVEEFKAWIVTVPDPDGTLMGWWAHKLMHEWILPGCIQCLSDIDKDRWHIMEATTNLGETQHKANNAATDIQMGIVESFIKYEAYDKRREAEIELMLKTGNVRNPRNDVVHRYDSRNKRGERAAEKTRHAYADDEEVQDAKQGLADAQARLKLAQAEHKSNSSGRVRVSRPRKRKLASDSDQPDEPTELSERAAFGDDNGSGINIAYQFVSALTSPDFLTAGPSTVSESQTTTSAQPPQKRLKLGPLKGWGVQRDGVAMSATDYAKNHWDEFQEEYPEYAKVVLSADSNE
ncbi:hypothetical protein C8R45DRAFT_1224512 [Mycena sanguinolenta]|nr:hypothetical protein C8R45DRAFT_1224512 [Mycena sanguinolenta]